MAKLTPEPAPVPAGPPPATHGAPARRTEHVAAARPAIPPAEVPGIAEPVPMGQVRAPFWLCVHPHRWRVLEGSVVPDPKVLHGTPGANGVDRRRDGQPVMKHAFDAQADQGWMVLDHQIAGAGTSYLKQVDATGGWISLWTTVYPGSANTRHDGKAEAAWWLDLVAAGKIRPAPLHVLEGMKAEHERRLVRFLDRGLAKDASRIKRIQTAIAAIDAEIGKYAEAA